MPRAKKPKANPSDLPVTVLPLADLTPYPKNPRHITPAAVNAVAESLQQFGWQQPIVIDPKKVIVAGHTRCQAALQLGWTHAPTVHDCGQARPRLPPCRQPQRGVLDLGFGRAGR